MLREAERLPEAVVTCIGAGSNAIGIFSGFLHDPTVRLVGVEAAGDGLETTRHSAALSRGKQGVFHGGMAYVLQNEDGQIQQSHSIAAGMDYPGVAPELSFWKDRRRIEVTSATDDEALQSFELLSRLEGIIPSLESAHAIHRAVILAGSMGDSADVLVCITGNGDKDVSIPANRGTVYVYGTSSPHADDSLFDVYKKWTADGTGGDGRGKLLATRHYDDGQCYQVNDGPISKQRQGRFRKSAADPQGADLWCQADIRLPDDLPTETFYSIYFIWTWPTLQPEKVASTSSGDYGDFPEIGSPAEASYLVSPDVTKSEIYKEQMDTSFLV
ncbi:hypothetical protein CCHR01_19770 [Colletotrichum chrysophilum]|uniref:tryptophan synthase n=1 Tax=Colletotrichum chrysophilum TaxID=1836956 RepID=A0AAD8ZZY4_9PEZI|nr:hypothetical protein CCHR01_19770 [Colletotrichum chrysophilum]